MRSGCWEITPLDKTNFNKIFEVIEQSYTSHEYGWRVFGEATTLDFFRKVVSIHNITGYFWVVIKDELVKGIAGFRYDSEVHAFASVTYFDPSVRGEGVNLMIKDLLMRGAALVEAPFVAMVADVNDRSLRAMRKVLSSYGEVLELKTWSHSRQRHNIKFTYPSSFICESEWWTPQDIQNVAEEFNKFQR